MKLSITSACIIVSGLIAAPPAEGQIGNGACDRSCLENWIDRYFDAVIDNDPDSLPMADTVRFTEDGVRLAIGDGLWNTRMSFISGPRMANFASPITARPVT